MKHKMKTRTNQVSRLRDEIAGREQALAKEQQEHKRLEKDNEALKVQQPASSSFSLLLFRPFSIFTVGKKALQTNATVLTRWERLTHFLFKALSTVH